MRTNFQTSPNWGRNWKNSPSPANTPRIKTMVVQQKIWCTRRTRGTCDWKGAVGKKTSPDEEEIIQFHDKRQLNNFRSFGIEIQNNENGEKERLDSDRYYAENHVNRSESNAKEKRRNFAEPTKNSKERRPRPS
ncbi:hypothetical protein JTB14_027630 [Gonioctena quinquepunctata]|nr:hypothetical protein JTB14_027630 [Gonioctena quinquepunctata]